MTSQELKKLRKDAGLTMADASRLFKTPYRTWQNWENGERRVPPMAGVILELYIKWEKVRADYEAGNIGPTYFLKEGE